MKDLGHPWQLGIMVVLGISTAIYAQQPTSAPTQLTVVVAPTKAAGAANAAISALPEPTKQAVEANDTLLKFQQELIAEAKAHREYLEKLLTTSTWVVGILAAVLTFFGVRELKTLKPWVKNVFLGRAEKLINRRLDPLLTDQNQRIERTREKLCKGIESICDALCKTSSSIFDELSGDLHKRREDIRGKRVLWVDDDKPGTILYIKVAKWCGLDIDMATTTQEAVADTKKAHYDLVITNLMRDDDPCEWPAGITLTSELTKLNNKGLRVVIFTRADRKNRWEKAAKDAGAAAVCGNPDELMVEIRKNLLVAEA